MWRYSFQKTYSPENNNNQEPFLQRTNQQQKFRGSLKYTQQFITKLKIYFLL